jgi:hypothetical protein
MPHADVLRTLVEELNRVGVDAEHMVAGLSARADEAIRALRTLPDDAGPAAFLAAFRQQNDSGQRAAFQPGADVAPSDEATTADVAPLADVPTLVDVPARAATESSRDGARPPARSLDRTA